MQIDTNDIIYIPPEENKKHLDTFLKKGDVILSKTAYPAASIVQLEGCNASQDTVAIKLKDKPFIDGANLVVFLNTKYGFEQMKRWFTGNIQMHLNLTDCKNIFIPVLEISFQKAVSKIFWHALLLKESSADMYDEAESLLLSEVGLNKFSTNVGSTNIKKLSESMHRSERIDAEYYQAKYEQYESVIKSYKGGYTFIKDEFSHIKKSSKKERPQYNYIEIGDVNVSDGSNTYTIRKALELPANAKYEVQKGDLLISKVRPNRGAVTIIEGDTSNLIVSGAFTVLRNKKDSAFSNEMLKVLCRTSIYRDWLLKYNIGTQYPVIRDDDILNMPIPNLNEIIQNKISEKVRQAHDKKMISDALLSITKYAVELAIQFDEKSARKYIDNECKKLGVDLIKD